MKEISYIIHPVTGEEYVVVEYRSFELLESIRLAFLECGYSQPSFDEAREALQDHIDLFEIYSTIVCLDNAHWFATQYIPSLFPALFIRLDKTITLCGIGGYSIGTRHYIVKSRCTTQ